MAKAKTQENKPLEQMLFLTADKLRKNIDAAEYKSYVLGFLFLKYVSDAFDVLHQKILNKDGAIIYHRYDGKSFTAQTKFFLNHIVELLEPHSIPCQIADSRMDGCITFIRECTR